MPHGVLRTRNAAPTGTVPTTIATIGIISAGHIGSNVARAAIAHGYDVVLSNSRGPEIAADLITELGPLARAATLVEATFLDELGFDAVDIGTLDESSCIESDTSAYVTRSTAEEFRERVAKAVRIQQAWRYPRRRVIPK